MHHIRDVSVMQNTLGSLTDVKITGLIPHFLTEVLPCPKQLPRCPPLNLWFH